LADAVTLRDACRQEHATRVRGADQKRRLTIAGFVAPERRAVFSVGKQVEILDRGAAARDHDGANVFGDLQQGRDAIAGDAGFDGQKHARTERLRAANALRIQRFVGFFEPFGRGRAG
jgi:hypothetical protein